VTSEVLLLVSRDGRIEAAAAPAAKDGTAFRRARPRLIGARIPIAVPDDSPLKLVQRGVLVCGAASGCALMRDIAGSRSLSDTE
jgi:hypothetical protein